MALPPSPALALLLVLLCATPGLGAPGGGCGVPPSDWCQSWDTALRCGALGHCARQAWAPPGTDVCADCQQVVTLLLHMVNESATKVAVEDFLRRECLALPVPTMVAPCQGLVHEYFSLILTHLEEHLKPSAVCAHLELCPADPRGASPLPPLKALSAHLQAGTTLPLPLPLCWLCRTFLARAQAAVPKEALGAAAAGLCRVLPTVAVGACQCLAQRYAELALEVLLGRLAPRLLCRLLLSCGPEGSAAQLPAPALPPRGLLPPAQPPLPAACAGTQALEPALAACALGPSFWCSSPAAARRCQALQHCQDHVWL